jgi:hypothetical protein
MPDMPETVRILAETVQANEQFFPVPFTDGVKKTVLIWK